MKLKKEDYVARISSATPLNLVIITYELLIENIDVSKESFDNGNYDEFNKHIKIAQDFLMTLMTSLNMKFEISKYLMSLYIYCNKLFIKCYFEKSIQPILEIKSILESLLESWQQLSQSDIDMPVMENTQKLVAGLTYKDGQLSEFIVESNNRGFKA